MYERFTLCYINVEDEPDDFDWLVGEVGSDFAYRIRILNSITASNPYLIWENLAASV